jgi:glycine cleavage system regulatory protein
MQKDIVIGFIGEDQPGIVRLLSQTVAEHQANWQESRMSYLGGFFSGIAQVKIDEAELPSLKRSLEAMEGFTVAVLDARADADNEPGRRMAFNIIGPDRKGILSEVSAQLAAQGINVLAMDTSIGPAPMSGEALFTTDAEVLVPEAVDLAELTMQLNDIADSLGVDVHIEDAESH